VVAITRIYRVKIKPQLRGEFEPLFRTVAIASVQEATGCTSAKLGGPTPKSPNEYSVTSVWNREESLTDFVGFDWAQAHIPEGMERFVDQCWVHHYTDM